MGIEQGYDKVLIFPQVPEKWQLLHDMLSILEQSSVPSKKRLKSERIMKGFQNGPEKVLILLKTPELSSSNRKIRESPETKIPNCKACVHIPIRGIYDIKGIVYLHQL